MQGGWKNGEKIYDRIGYWFNFNWIILFYKIGDCIMRHYKKQRKDLFLEISNKITNLLESYLMSLRLSSNNRFSYSKYNMSEGKIWKFYNITNNWKEKRIEVLINLNSRDNSIRIGFTSNISGLVDFDAYEVDDLFDYEVEVEKSNNNFGKETQNITYILNIPSDIINVLEVVRNHANL